MYGCSIYSSCSKGSGFLKNNGQAQKKTQKKSDDKEPDQIRGILKNKPVTSNEKMDANRHIHFDVKLDMGAKEDVEMIRQLRAEAAQDMIRNAVRVILCHDGSCLNVIPV